MSPDKDSLDSGAADKDAVAGDTEGAIDWEKKAAEFESGVAEAQKSLADFKVEAETNIRRLSSSLQAQSNSRASESETEKKRWEDAYHQEKMSGMEDAEALRYDNARLIQALQDQEVETKQAQIVVGEVNAKQNYIHHFTTLGVPLTKLNTRGSLQELADSGYGGLEALRTSEKTTLEETRQANADQATEIERLRGLTTDPNALAESQGDLKSQRVATLTHGSAGETVRTWEDAMKEASNVTGRPVTEEEEVWRLVEQQILKPTIIPGLENPPTEE